MAGEARLRRDGIGWQVAQHRGEDEQIETTRASMDKTAAAHGVRCLEFGALREAKHSKSTCDIKM